MAQTQTDAASRMELGRTDNGNTGRLERWLARIGGGGLLVYGLARRGPLGVGLAILGGGLVAHGAAGRSPFYRALGINRANPHPGPHASVHHLEGIRVERAVTINRPAADIFQFWRRFENLPRIMRHLESVQTLDERRSHWVATAPGGRRVEWDAEIVREVPDELIAWRSVDGAGGVANAGSLLLRSAPFGRGTEVKVELAYDPPAGPLGAAIAAAFREEPGQQVHDDLLRFKELMEAGEVATTEGQPSGPRPGRRSLLQRSSLAGRLGSSSPRPSGLGKETSPIQSGGIGGESPRPRGLGKGTSPTQENDGQESQ